MKKHLKLVLVAVACILLTSFATSYFATKNMMKFFIARSLETSAFNGIHRVDSLDRLEQLLIKGCNSEALDYVRMEQSLELLKLKDNIKYGAKIDKETNDEYASIIKRANTEVNKGKYFIPTCK